LKIRKRKIFRCLVDTFDGINIWIEDLTGTNAKRKILEAKQDLVTLRELDETIGKHLDIT